MTRFVFKLLTNYAAKLQKQQQQCQAQ